MTFDNMIVRNKNLETREVLEQDLQGCMFIFYLQS